MKCKKLLCKKRHGEQYVVTSVCIFVSVMFLSVAAISFGSWMLQFMLADEVDLAMTSTMKRMETIGYLDDTTANELKEELQAIGMEDISFSGSTSAAENPQYGEKIKLVLSGQIKNNSSFVALCNFFHVTDDCSLTYTYKTKEGTNKSR